MNDFLRNNPFVVCSEELNHVKHHLAREGDSVRVRHKTGVILYKATQNRSVVYTVAHYMYMYIVYTVLPCYLITCSIMYVHHVLSWSLPVYQALLHCISFKIPGFVPCPPSCLGGLVG